MVAQILLIVVGSALPQDRTQAVRIENHSFQPVVVYALRGATRVRLGEVRALRDRTFRESCATFNGGRVDFLIRPRAAREEHVLRGTRVSCGRRVIVVKVGSRPSFLSFSLAPR